jgi:hypothetical protein
VDRLLRKRERLIEDGRFYGMEMNMVKTKLMCISRQPSPVHIVIDQRQLDNVEYFNCVGSKLINDARCLGEIKPRIAVVKTNSTRRLFSPANLI